MDFYRRVAEVSCRIPWGRVATYGQIALLCGRPHNARQVGYALNRKIKDQAVPAHRVVNTQGYLSGAGAFEHPDLQKQLLLREGVAVSSEQRVDLNLYRWKNTLQEALDLQEYFEKTGI